MIYVYPTNHRSFFRRILAWPAVFAQVYVLHPANGWRYALEWANASLKPASALR